MAEIQGLGDAHWNKSELAVARVGGEFFANRPMIMRDTPINGGVYIGAHAREAIVVDDEKDEALRGAYADFLKLVDPDSTGKVDKQAILTNVYKYAKKIMPVDKRNVRDVQNALGGEKKVGLSKFFKGGVCRHQALLIGYMLEKLKDDGYIHGQVSIDRNSNKVGGHAWVRYTNSQGKVVIMDATQGFFGSLAKAQREAAWPYSRPEDPVVFEESRQRRHN